LSEKGTLYSRAFEHKRGETPLFDYLSEDPFGMNLILLSIFLVGSVAAKTLTYCRNGTADCSTINVREAECVKLTEDIITAGGVAEWGIIAFHRDDQCEGKNALYVLNNFIGPMSPPLRDIRSISLVK
jgi:hypothetical protein